VRWALPTAVAALLLLAPATGQASVTVGSKVDPGPADIQFACGLSGCTNVQTTHSSPPAAAPSGGVVVSWRARGIGQWKLSIVRKVGFQYMGVANSAYEQLTSGVLNSFATRLPIEAGDLTGASSVSPTAKLGQASSAPLGASGALFEPPLADGITASSVDGGPIEQRLDAQVEPDADHDGYGDESQDQCPADATTQGACPQPPKAATASIAGKVKAKAGKKGKVTVDTGVLAACPAGGAACTGTGSITAQSKVAKTVTFGKKTFTVAAGQSQRVKLTLNKKGSKKLKEAGKLKVKIAVTVTGPDGKPVSSARNAKLKLTKKR
jgi:hypothetical protein